VGHNAQEGFVGIHTYARGPREATIVSSIALLLGYSMQSWQQSPTLSGAQQLLKSRGYNTSAATLSQPIYLSPLARFHNSVLEAAKLEPHHSLGLKNTTYAVT